MLVNLYIHELWYLLERCLHGSHLRSDTIERFTNEFYEKLSEHERMNLFEWAVRLGYVWGSDKHHFEPSSTCCGHDTEFMKRYHPLNQYKVTMQWLECSKKKRKTLRCFKMGGKYHTTSTRFCAPEYITKVEHIDLSKQWEEHKVENIDYDTNILE